jgi:hypothetical protein
MVHRQRALSSLAGSLLLLLMACDGSSSPSQPGGAISFTTVHKGTSQGIPPFGEGIAVSDQQTWESAWQELNQPGAPPAVDFSHDMVLLVTGPGCGHVEIRSVSESQARVMVDAERTVCINFTCIPETYSVHAVSVPRTPAPVDFTYISTNKSC